MNFVTIQVRLSSLTGALVGTFKIHPLALAVGNMVRAEAGGAILPITEIVWLGNPAADPALSAIVVVTP